VEAIAHQHPPIVANLSLRFARTNLRQIFMVDRMPGDLVAIRLEVAQLAPREVGAARPDRARVDVEGPFQSVLREH
jgi:hypothetical protein